MLSQFDATVHQTIYFWRTTKNDIYIAKDNYESEHSTKEFTQATQPRRCEGSMTWYNIVLYITLQTVKLILYSL